MQIEKPWALEIGAVALCLSSNLGVGLTHFEARARLARYGLNQLKEGKRVSGWVIFFRQFKDFIIWGPDRCGRNLGFSK